MSNTFCTGETITFTASGATSYEFLVNGTVVQARSTVQTFTTVLTANSSVTVIGNTTTQTASLNMFYNEVQAGTISGTQSICYGEPASMSLETHGSVGGIPLMGLGTGFYQWQSSLDRISWSDVPSATSANLTVPSLVLSTYFRLNTENRVNGVLCADPSDWVEVTVAPNLLGGTIDQSDYILCAGDIPQELTVSGGSSGASILYQWQKSVNGGTNYTDIPFETNPNFIASSVTETTRFRRVTYSALGSCTIMSNDLQVTFDDILPGSLDPSQDSAICYNSIPPLISNGATGIDATSSVGTITYQWQQSINNLIWTDLSSGNLSYYTPTQVITQTTWFRRQGISTTGTLTCSDTTNAIQFLVYDEIIPGNTTGDQTICEDDVPATLNLLGASTDLGLTHQWQNSLDNIVFANIPNTGTSLPFTASSGWTPSRTTFFGVLTSNAFGCTVTSTVTEITVIEKSSITQTTASSPIQFVCPGSAIVTATFKFEGSATGITASNLAGSGLSFNGPVGNEYTLSGVPTGDTAITLTSDVVSPCTVVSLQYNVILIQPAQVPTLIRKGVDDAEHSVFQMDDLWYNNTICQSATPTTTAFYVCQETTVTVTPTYEWKVEPGIAGVMNTASGEISWDSFFTGTATISVRGLSCGGNSDWLDTPIEVVSPTTVPTQLATPTVLMDAICGLTPTEIPECEIDAATPNTQFYATTASGISDYASIEWSLDAIFPAGGLTGVASPGIIDVLTG